MTCMGDELAQPIENFIPIYRRVKEDVLRLKAHIGEWGTAGNVVRGVDALQLDGVQHGIAAAELEEAIQCLKDRGIRLNLTPNIDNCFGKYDMPQIRIQYTNRYKAGRRSINPLMMDRTL